MPRPPGSRGGRRIDLHTHSCFSDGALAPEALIQRAVERGLTAIAITDHDSVEALPFARAAAPPALEIVPGIELSSSRSGLDLHVLGYYLDPDHPRLVEQLLRFREARRARAIAIAERLERLGASVDVGSVLAGAEPGVIGRPHLAAALVEAGHVESLDEAFRRYLGPQGEAYVPRPAFRPDEAIGLIHDAGGVAVLAHPGGAVPDAVIETLAADGLDGIEVWHPQHAAPAVRRLQAMASRLGLLTTGGSDFHGPGRSWDLGDIPVPIEALAALKRAAGVAG
jgi:predicted metal-dependent phosphoesterase TrpH